MSEDEQPALPLPLPLPLPYPLSLPLPLPLPLPPPPPLPLPPPPPLPLISAPYPRLPLPHVYPLRLPTPTSTLPLPPPHSPPHPYPHPIPPQIIGLYFSLFGRNSLWMDGVRIVLYIESLLVPYYIFIIFQTQFAMNLAHNILGFILIPACIQYLFSVWFAINSDVTQARSEPTRPHSNHIAIT